jgi:hypothetical protein
LIYEDVRIPFKERGLLLLNSMIRRVPVPAKKAPDIVQTSLFGDCGTGIGHGAPTRPAPQDQNDTPVSRVSGEKSETPFKTLQDLLGPDGDPAVQQLVADVRNGRVSHAYLIGGRSRARNWDVARAFALALICEISGSGIPCGTCKTCRAVTGRGAHPDLHILEAGGISLKMEQVRDLRAFFSFGASAASHHVYLIRGPERLTPPAASSLLKAIEEPPPGAVFILVSEEDRLPQETIVSRCRKVALREPGADREADVVDAPPEFEEIGRSLESGAGFCPAQALEGCRQGQRCGEEAPAIPDRPLRERF